ncbi:hypothetical protein NH8B_2080 [Pseudogulbenkiania sp. NH8B]|uniref:helix-turn-helix domain-containing protein n=1 Tax=Pseudogulbenkiania sp. (strain NH8B) TaxID=748280 RepID=UPI0002279B3D|nr:helix-turn-helix transcriptional regulator [Pseudogulbenkiania sp. NH8B]BAK76466.1 hypothetical protein NH8B_1649 [Pseudogulbenkiania sp. NH8B]BAK76895.1 hypothetical protein NH8B_2080 [Pseudogulbenkiania sp. NH8B]
MSNQQRIDYRALRKSKDLNQQDFWGPVYVTQSGGSRYESGRDAPEPVAELVRLYHELGIDTRLITPENAPLIRAVLDNGMKVARHDDRAD